MELLIPRMAVQTANLLVAQHFVSPTPILQALLFAHALGREIDRQPLGVAVLHHDAQPLGEERVEFFPQQRRGSVLIDQGDYAKGGNSLSLQPTVTGHLLLSLVLRFDEGPAHSDVERFLRHARFSGGQVLGHAPLVSCDTPRDIERHVRTGYWLIERSDLVEPHAPLESLVQALGRRAESSTSRGSKGTAAGKDGPPVPPFVDVLQHNDIETQDFALEIDFENDDIPEDDDIEREANGDAWLAPAVLGYALTTDLSRRRGVRGEGLHAFAEPLIGLVQFLSARHWRQRRIAELPWWRCGWRSADVFVGTQDPELSLSSSNPGDFR